MMNLRNRKLMFLPSLMQRYLRVPEMRERMEQMMRGMNWIK